MRVKFSKNFLFVIVSVVIVSGVFVGGAYVGYSHRPFVDRVYGVSNKDTGTDNADFEPFWKVWNLINQKYPNASDISKQDRVYGAIKGLVDSLGDPYSVFFPPEDSKDFADTIHGSFEGIGMEVGMKDKILTVIAPLKGTPAEKAGIKPGDKILKIDDTVTSDMTVDKAVHLIRGKGGTDIRLTIYREGENEPLEISVTRAVIDIPTIETNKREDGIFVVTLYNFGLNSAVDMAGAIDEYNASNYKNLIIDLRGNPGGYLDAAVNIGSFFLPRGDVIVSESKGKDDQNKKVYRSKGFNAINPKNNKIVVLVDKGSASASEIIAGAFKEHGIAKIIGETTYGKGSVQELLDVTGDTTVKITVADWLTPNGNSISKKGITPDIAVEQSDSDTKLNKDTVMERAVSFIKSGK